MVYKNLTHSDSKSVLDFIPTFLGVLKVKKCQLIYSTCILGGTAFNCFSASTFIFLQEFSARISLCFISNPLSLLIIDF